MVGECSDSNPDAAVQYIYTENSYEPLARVDSRSEHAEVYWYHTELNGLPEKVTGSSGDIVWQGVSTTWGRSERENSNADWDVPQNLRFQGQYLDRETGLHYNTFRYYDPCGGRYTQMDPIGLLGGLNTYTYVVDPLTWVDPLGLSCRNNYLGRTPGKKSRTGREVIERMRNEGKIQDVAGETYFQASDSNWYPLREADMSHTVDAVTWWNETGRYLGPKSRPVRSWMLDSKNYYLDHYSINRSQGAMLGQVYLPPIISP
ncbi:RHS domain-containing protein [Kosakonia sacchari]|nr:RHS domain-containing protein [Kosakonia sacchari]